MSNAPSRAEVAAALQAHQRVSGAVMARVCACGWPQHRYAVGGNAPDHAAHLADVVAQVYAPVVEAVERVEALHRPDYDGCHCRHTTGPCPTLAALGGEG